MEDQVKSQTKGEKPIEFYSAFTGYCFTTNYIIGVGVLSIPNAFIRTGFIMAPVMLIIATFLLSISIIWLVEVIARVQAIERRNNQIYPSNSNDSDLFVLTEKRYEINELAGIVIGRPAQIAYTVLLFCFLYATLWSYASVFSSSLLVIVPFPGISTSLTCDVYDPSSPLACEISYRLYSLILTLLVLPISLLDISEQAGLQICLTIFRFVSISLMFITTVIAMFNSPFISSDQTSAPYIAFSDAIRPSGIPFMFATAIFAQLMHHSVPGVVQPLANKSKVKVMFMCALLTTCILYLLIGLPTSLYFGDTISPVISLSWVNYTGLSFASSINAHTIAKIISYVIVLFPPIDIISAYPINSITLANDIYSNLSVHITENQTNQLVKIGTRLFVVLPPIILSLIVKKLDSIIEIASTFGFFITLICPALMQIKSKQKCMEIFGRDKTPYSGMILSSTPLAWAIFIFGSLGFLFQITMVITQIVNGQLK